MIPASSHVGNVEMYIKGGLAVHMTKSRKYHVRFAHHTISVCITTWSTDAENAEIHPSNNTIANTTAQPAAAENVGARLPKSIRVQEAANTTYANKSVRFVFPFPAFTTGSYSVARLAREMRSVSIIGLNTSASNVLAVAKHSRHSMPARQHRRPQWLLAWCSKSKSRLRWVLLLLLRSLVPWGSKRPRFTQKNQTNPSKGGNHTAFPRLWFFHDQVMLCLVLCLFALGSLARGKSALDYDK